MKNYFYWRILTKENQRLTIRICSDKTFPATWKLTGWEGESRFVLNEGVIENSNIKGLIEELMPDAKTEALRLFGWQLLVRRKNYLDQVTLTEKGGRFGAVKYIRLDAQTTREQSDKKLAGFEELFQSPDKAIKALENKYS